MFLKWVSERNAPFESDRRSAKERLSMEIMSISEWVWDKNDIFRVWKSLLNLIFLTRFCNPTEITDFICQPLAAITKWRWNSSNVCYTRSCCKLSTIFRILFFADRNQRPNEQEMIVLLAQIPILVCRRTISNIATGSRLGFGSVAWDFWLNLLETKMLDLCYNRAKNKRITSRNFSVLHVNLRSETNHAQWLGWSQQHSCIFGEARGALDRCEPNSNVFSSKISRNFCFDYVGQPMWGQGSEYGVCVEVN